MKKILSIIIMVAMILPNVLVSAQSTSNYDENNAIVLSKALEIMQGDQTGDMMLDKNVSRAEFSKISINMSVLKNMVPASSNITAFRDCTFKHWAAPYVGVAARNSIITGYPDGTFRPSENVLLEEAVTVMLKLLGYTSEDFGTSWPYGQMGIARNLHLLDNVSASVGEALTRRDVLKIVYNTLTAQPKAGGINSKYLETLECDMYEDAVIIATNDEDNSVSPGHVLTSAGTFKITDSFDKNLIGRKGDLIVKKDVYYSAFMQSPQTLEKHVVYSKLDDSIITYCNNSLTKFSPSDALTTYKDTSKTTFGAVKSSLSTGDNLYVMKDFAGNIDYALVTTDNFEGPFIVATRGNLDKYGISQANLTVMRDGEKSSLAEIAVNDVLYYLKEINTAFVYTKKVTGVYEKATPNRDMPTSVTVSGTTYALETASAFNKLSSSGPCKIGDTVTLLLGKDGQIADVVTNLNETQKTVGVLSKTGNKEFENAEGEKYTSNYATLICSDSSELEVITDVNYENYIGRTMQATFKSGIASLSVAKPQITVSGKADQSAMVIGTRKVAKDAQISDVAVNDNVIASKRIYMQRLDGITLSTSKVLYDETNSKGEISKLILDNVTGDVYDYGIVTKISEASSPMGDSSYFTKRYTCDIGGTLLSTDGSLGFASNISKGSPCGVLTNGGNIASIKSLEVMGTVKEMGEGFVTISDKNLLCSDKVVVYKSNLSGGNSSFTILPYSELKENIDDYIITAYADSAEKYGGRIRVIVARSK